MREIEFRGKNKDTGEWIYFDFYRSHYREKTDFNYRVVDFKTVGQYTGLIDKNGVKIFEGDIVNANNMTLIVSYASEVCSFVADSIDRKSSFFMRDVITNGVMGDGIIEVISNIHDKLIFGRNTNHEKNHRRGKKRIKPE